MNKRETALLYAKVAGYHADSKAFIRLIVESRVNREAMNSAWYAGQTAKQNGIKCHCRDCNQPAQVPA